MPDTTSPALAAARKHHTTAGTAHTAAVAESQRLATRLRDADTTVQQAERDAIHAAGSATADDDGPALRALSDARIRRDMIGQAHALSLPAVDAAARRVDVAAQAIAVATADESFHRARAILQELEAAVAAVARHAADFGTAWRAGRAEYGSMPEALNHAPYTLHVDRYVRHALIAAGVNVDDDGPRQSPPAAIATHIGGLLTRATQEMRGFAPTVAQLAS